MPAEARSGSIERTSVELDKTDQPSRRSDVCENEALEALGYANPYRRMLKTLGTLCMVISLTSPLSAICITAFYQIGYGGYWGLTWGWLIPSLVFLPQALAAAALCSAMPVNGAFYWWTAAMAPKWCSKFLSFVSGWVNLLTLATSIASFAFAVTSSTVQGIIYVAPQWSPSNAELMGIAFGVVFLWLALASRRLEEISWVYLACAAIILIHLVVFVVALPASHAIQNKPFASARDVLGSYTNYSDWSPAVAVPFTWFTASWVNSAWAAPAYVVEATHDARRSAPKAILMAYSATAISGLVICVICAFCITDMDAMAADPTGFPLLTLVYEHWGAPATAAFVLVVMICTIVGGSAILLAYSFQIAAFARDGGVPFADTFSKVNQRVNMPVRAIIALCCAGCLLLLFGLSNTASAIIYSLAVMAYLLTYSLPNLLVVLSGDRWTPGPFNYGRFDKPVFAWAFCSQLYLAVMQAFPPMRAWTAATFNYNWIVTVGVLLLAVALYLVVGRHKYRGIDLDAVRSLQLQGHGHGHGQLEGVSPVESRATVQQRKMTSSAGGGDDDVTKVSSTTKM